MSLCLKAFVLLKYKLCKGLGGTVVVACYENKLYGRRINRQAKKRKTEKAGSR